MKYLSHYTEQGQTELFNSLGAFFAFSQSQLDEAKKEGVTYVSMGSGLICPKDNAKELMLGLESNHAQGIAADIAENGIEAIIQRELGNHEAQITGDLDDTMRALEGYGVTEAQVKEGYKTFYDLCVENDCF
jgi:hypothetical protein